MRGRPKLIDDERTAANERQAHRAFDVLLVTTGPDAADRRALGTILALDRAKALKFYAVVHASLRAP